MNSHRLGLLVLPLVEVSRERACRIVSDLIISLLGYSFKTNQYGLAVDNVVAYNLVLPSGEVIVVAEDSYPDLFFGLKVCGHLPLSVHDLLT